MIQPWPNPRLAPDAVRPAHLEHLWIPSGEHWLAASIDLPTDHAAPWPVAVIIHGFSGNRMGRSYHFVEFGRHLASQGIACLRFDQAGCGESTGPQREYSLPTIRRDCLAVGDFLEQDERFDHDRLGLVGASMGAIGALTLDAARPARCISLWAPVFDLANLVREKTGGQRIEESFHALGFVPYRGLRLGPAWFENLASEDPAALVARNLHSPILIIHSRRDEVVPIRHGRQYAEAAEAAGRPHEFVTIDESTHDFHEQPERGKLLSNALRFMVNHLL